VSIVKVLPDLHAPGGAQMAFDTGLLDTAEDVTARRYTWAPPALSLGKFQRFTATPGLPFAVVRRPSGGRAVLHGEGFEWSFAVAFPPGFFGGERVARDVALPYKVVAAAFAGALDELGVRLDSGHDTAYAGSALCFAGTLRHDLLSRGEKVVAIAQARREGRVLVHGSVLERRPPDELTAAAASLFGEPWRGDGLAGAGQVVVRDTLWRAVLRRLEALLTRMTPAAGHPGRG
jgi:lipoate-protein ligase A